MMQINKQTYIIFDLDDTLYKENSYHDSGMEAVSRLVDKLYGVESLALLREWKRAGINDLWGRLCREFDLPAAVKEALIWQYRLHYPNICLPDENRKVLDELGARVQGIAILTDGRSITQRQKIAALGLEKYPVYISEEWDSEKPCEKRFRAIMAEHPAQQYIYVGDNPQKDFLAPNKLGWLTVGLRGDKQNIHPQKIDGLADDYLPAVWIGGLAEVCGVVS